MKISLVLCLILTWPILSTANLTNSPNPQVTLIKSGDLAPYQGFLVPPEMLRQLQTDHLNGILYKNELTKIQGQTPLYTPTDRSFTVVVGVVALLVGFLVGSSIR